MKSHINRVNTPCPDENFNRMIRIIPDLVMGPLEEKQSQWDTEKDGLEKQLETLRKEKKAWIERKKQLEFDVKDWKGSYDAAVWKWKKEVDSLNRRNKHDKEQCYKDNYYNDYRTIRSAYDRTTKECGRKELELEFTIRELQNQLRNC